MSTSVFTGATTPSTTTSSSFLYGSANTLTVYLAVVLAIVTFFFAMYYFYRGRSPLDVAPSMVKLNAATDVGLPSDVDAKILKSGASTVMGFFNFLDGDRTAQYNTKDAFAPFFKVENNWAMEMSQVPTSSAESGTFAARLKIYTTSNARGSIVEEIPLPPIPYQRWIFLAILREGRRYDVMYDNQIVASHRLENYPVNKTAALTVGHPRLRGSAIHVMYTNRRMTIEEINRERLRFVDTNGMIIEDHTVDALFPKFTWPYFATCAPGMPCEMVSVPPKDNLVKWSTPYA